MVNCLKCKNRLLAYNRYILRMINIFSSLIMIIFFNMKYAGATDYQYDSLFVGVREDLDRSGSKKAISSVLDIIKENRNNIEIINHAHILLAESYRIQMEYRKGIDLLYDVLKSSGLSTYNRAYAYNRMAALYNESRLLGIDRRDSTKKYSILCLEISEKNNFIELMAASQNEMAYLFRLEKDIENAIIYGQRAYENFYLIGDYPNAMNAAINLCGAFLSTGKIQKGLTMIDSVEKYLSPDDYQNLFARLYLRRSDLYAALGKYQQAYKVLSKARILQKDVFIRQMDEQISEMIAKYDLELKENQIRLAEYEIETRKQKFILSLMVSVLLVFVLAVMIFNFRLQKKIKIREKKLFEEENNKLKIQLDYKQEALTLKNKELGRAIYDTIAFNDVLKQIRHALEMGNKDEALRIISVNRKLEHNWKKFRLNFENIYPGFLDTLAQKYPQLTQNDLKICAFILMDMKTVEIAEFSGISEASVSKSRNRLRKKLNLEIRTDLSAFLKSIA